MQTRRAKIEAMLADDPKDLFLRYSLAMEIAKEGDAVLSIEQFQSLTQEQPPYVPAFFMAAQKLVEIERIEEARSMLREGIEAARSQRDSHAAGEMSQFLASLGTH